MSRLQSLRSVIGYCCKANGLVVLPREEMLPAHPEPAQKEHQKMLPALPAFAPEPDAPLLFWEEERREQRPLLRKRCAERRMKEAFQRLEEAELRQEPGQKLAWYEDQFAQEVATYGRVMRRTNGPGAPNTA